jgi:hypothetical protein
MLVATDRAFLACKDYYGSMVLCTVLRNGYDKVLELLFPILNICLIS